MRRRNGKNALKGVSKCFRQCLTHEALSRVLNLSAELSFPVARLQVDDHEMRLKRMHVRALNAIDNKRYLIDKDKSYAYGHPDIPNRIEPSTNSLEKRHSNALTTRGCDGLDLFDNRRGIVNSIINHMERKGFTAAPDAQTSGTGEGGVRDLSSELSAASGVGGEEGLLDTSESGSM